MKKGFPYKENKEERNNNKNYEYMQMHYPLKINQESINKGL